MSNRSNYCKHGTYIGDPYGPDYMCHWCEMGYEPPELHLILLPDDYSQLAPGELVEILLSLEADGLIPAATVWRNGCMYVPIYQD